MTVGLALTYNLAVMQNKTKRDFDSEARTWDDNPYRIAMAAAVAAAMREQVTFGSDMDVMDYGSGTGLVTLAIQPYVRSITAADSSQGMLDVLGDKISAAGIDNASTLLLDLENSDPPDLCLDAIVSSMTVHHVKDTRRLVGSLASMLRPGGYLLIADLDTEDGSFHGNDAGVWHNGFDRREMEAIFASEGLQSVRSSTAHVLSKPIEGRGPTDFPIFLVVGQKP